MNAISIKGDVMELELNQKEYEILMIQGLRLELKELGSKAVLVPVSECKKLGLRLKKGAKKFELNDEECRLMIEKAVNHCLREKIKEEKAKKRKK